MVDNYLMVKWLSDEYIELAGRSLGEPSAKCHNDDYAITTKAMK